jgi:hypothetical protein
MSFDGASISAPVGPGEMKVVVAGDDVADAVVDGRECSTLLEVRRSFCAASRRCRASGVRGVGQGRGHHLHPGIDQRLVVDLGWDAEDIA